MSLSLTVTSYRGEPPLQPISLTLDRQGGSIGRSADNNLVLPDPEKYVSSHHAVIEFRDNTYYLGDTSSNGVFILPSETALGRNNVTALADGDKLSIGEYQLMVAVLPDEFLSPVSNDIEADPYAETIRTAAEDNPFADLDTDPISELIHNADDGDDDFDFFGSQPSPGPAREFAAEPDHVPSLDEAFAPLQGSQEPVQQSEPQSAGGFLPENWFSSDDDNTAEPVPEPKAKPEPVPEPRPEPPPIRKPTPAAPKPSAVAPAKPKHAAVAAAADDNTREQDQKCIHLFCQGAGIPKDLEQQLSPETFLVIGEMLRIAIQGAMEVLMARTKIKNEMRLDVTTIRAVENNPIKFSINADEAMARLLQNSDNDGYQEPVQALAEAFDDIRAHQMAVISGMQTALQSILKRFDPEKLETRLQKQSPISASIPIHKQAKLWSQFEQLYEDIEHEAQDDFNRLFGNAFASAYEQQIDRFKQTTEK